MMPHDITAEQATLGAMLTSPAMAAELARYLVAADFYRPAHQLIFEAVASDVATADPVTVNSRLAAAGKSEVTGGAPYLHTLMEACPLAVNGTVYAQTVREHAIARRVEQAGMRLTDWARSREGDSAALIERALREIEEIRATGQASAGTRARPVYEFLDVPSGADAYDWVIRDLLERGDRFILTGVEGGGKSEFFRQLAVCTAAGIHPLYLTPSETPRRVWLLDRENSQRHTRRKLWPLMEQAAKHGKTVEGDNLWVDSTPERMDLARDRDVSWLLSEAAAIKPDIVFMGPLYKLAPRALNDDDDAAPVLAALDMLRERGIAICLEAHAGHGLTAGVRDMRVRGSAAFMGWPEFAYGLQWSSSSTPATRVVDLISWRGDRDMGRAWPVSLRQGADWPWTAIYPEGTFSR